jgi:hypothetical protein
MDVDPEDQEIIRLLTKIKDAEGEYPEQMLVARRHHFLKRMGEVSLGIPADMGIKNVANDVNPFHISPTTTMLVETALVVVIIAEASTVSYFYRDRLTDFFHRAVTEPRVQEVTPSLVVPTTLEIQEIAPLPALTITVPAAATWSPPNSTGMVITPTGTALPEIIPGVGDDINTVTPAEGNVLNATAGPNDSSLNHGNHYGQTPKPERTKENGNNPPPNEDKLPKEDNNQPPKEDKPPKDNNDKLPRDNSDKPPKN